MQFTHTFTLAPGAVVKSAYIQGLERFNNCADRLRSELQDNVTDPAIAAKIDSIFCMPENVRFREFRTRYLAEAARNVQYGPFDSPENDPAENILTYFGCDYDSGSLYYLEELFHRAGTA